ncbi:MAG: C40 family peptidase [Vicinamibacterales bacterium]
MAWRLLLAALVAMAASACASSGRVTAPVGTAPPEARALEAFGHRIAATALEFRGVPYRNGGTTPAGFDCSGLVQYVLARHGRDVPRQTRDQYGVGTKIRRDAVRAGDLVFFSTVASGASHVGIALDGEEFVHAPSSRGVVRVERLSTEYWRRRFVGARRVR